jgi:hypothetical protein
VSVLLAGLQAGPARASGGGQSSSGSSNGSDSSKGSGDSSNNSNESSKSSNDSSNSSNDSSKESGNSSETSPQKSSEGTSQGSSDWTTHSNGAHMFSFALAAVALGATVLGVFLTDRGRQGPPPAPALAGFMRRQHAMLLHDVATAEGPVLDAWAHDLRLTAAEKTRLRRALDGSVEQGQLIDSLDGKIDDKHAERFGAAFVRVTQRAIGRARMNALVARAIAATRGG